MAEPKVPGSVKTAFGLAATLAAFASIIGDGTLGWLVTPVVLGGIFFAASKAPLRYSLVTLAFCALTIDYPTEQFASGYYTSPLYYVGWALLSHLNNLTDQRWMSFSGSDIIIWMLIYIAWSREKSRSPIDRIGRVPMPPILIKLAKVSLMGMVWLLFWGIIRGGDVGKSLWQAERVFYLPVLFLLYSFGLRGPRDHILLAKLFLFAAGTRALLAIYIKRTVSSPPDPNTGISEPLAYATSHSDSMLFASAFVMLVLLIVERVPKAKKLVALLMPLLVLGMVYNNRRLVWVHVAVILLTLYVVAPDNAVKRAIRRTVYAGIPVVIVYAAAGWNSGSKIFKPVKIMRSVVEPSTDGSSLWRELENYNLVFTLRDSPIFGQGYGHRWIELVKLPAVSYDLEYYLPHNSLLGLWAAGGYVGYTAITMLWGIGVFFAMRAYHAATVPTDRVAAILCVGAVMVYLVQCFGDLGLGSWTGVHILAPALAVAGKLAVSTGAWPVAGQTPSAPQVETRQGGGFGARW